MSTITAPPGTTAPDLGALKERQQAAWSSGNYAIIGSRLQIVGETLCEAVDLHAGERVLDVCSGNGNAALAAARRFGRVTATDYVPALLERGAARAAADGIDIEEFRVADTEALPFEDGSFDVVLSTFGVMFTADHDRAVGELIRVTRPGGRIGMANWTPEGFIGQLFRVLGRHVPPPSGARPPSLWGTREWLDRSFGAEASAMEARPVNFVFRFPSPEYWLEYFRTWYGPTLKAFASLDEAGRDALAADILALVGSFNRADDGTMVVPGEYLEIVIHKA